MNASETKHPKDMEHATDRFAPNAHKHPAIASAAHAEIQDRLQQAEAEHGIKVLWAIESGSRAWGFASPDSDYDARFVYVHPADWYLSVDLQDRRDVIEYPIVDDMDINGWDLRKALALYMKSNPSLIEWIHSPIVYHRFGPFIEGVHRLLDVAYNPLAGMHHYHSMAKQQFASCRNAKLVKLKKYFYTLRPLLSVRWLEQHASPPPIEFEKLLPVLAGVPDEGLLLADIQTLLTTKRQSPELGMGDPVPSIHRFIEDELHRLADLSGPPPTKQPVRDQVNALFRECLQAAWA